MINSLKEIFPITPILNVDLPIPLKSEKETVISQFLSPLDLTYYSPHNELVPIIEHLIRRGLSAEHLELFRKIHEGGHGFLALSGLGIQQSLLESWQLQDYIKAITIVSGKINEESYELVEELWKDMEKINIVKNKIYSRSIELHEAFAGFCTTVCPIEEKSEFKSLSEININWWVDKGYRETLRFYKDFMWINKKFGLDTLINSLKLSLNVNLFTREFIDRIVSTNKLPVYYNPRARFAMIRSALEKHGHKAKIEINDSSPKVEKRVFNEIYELRMIELMKTFLLDEEYLWYNPTNLLTSMIERDMIKYSTLEGIILGRYSSITVKEVPPGSYWKEARKGETKRRLYHPVTDVLVFKVRDDIDSRLTGPLHNTFVISALKDQLLSENITCLKECFEHCVTKHVGRTKSGWDKFKELKCRECGYYTLIKKTRKISEIHNAFKIARTAYLQK